MQQRIFKLFTFFLLFCSLAIEGQLYRGSADFTDRTSYQVGGVYDSLFIFYASNPDKYVEAYPVVGDSAIFDWYTFNTGSGIYEFLRSDTGDVAQTNIVESVGIRVVIRGETTTDTLRCWALIDDLSVFITSADTLNEGENWIKVIPLDDKWCHLIRNIQAEIDSSEMTYYNPVTGVPILLPAEFYLGVSCWSAKPEITDALINRFVSQDISDLLVDVSKPYWEDSWYMITIVDQFGYSCSDSVFYETIEPHAAFEYEYIHLGNPLYYPDRSENYYDIFYDTVDYKGTSAPALFKFDNLSINADSMVWRFGDEIVESSLADSILHTYQLPGKYRPKLVVYVNYEHLYGACIDSVELEDNDTIIVDESEILANDAALLPNVFTCPDGNSLVFRFMNDISITDFEIVIFNRFGKRVYHYKGNIRDWEGWDGRDKSSDAYVATGVYYYVVKKLEVLPDYNTGNEVRLESHFPGQIIEEGKKKAIPSLYRGFIHVYNNE